MEYYSLSCRINPKSIKTMFDRGFLPDLDTWVIMINTWNPMVTLVEIA